MALESWKRCHKEIGKGHHLAHVWLVVWNKPWKLKSYQGCGRVSRTWASDLNAMDIFTELGCVTNDQSFAVVAKLVCYDHSNVGHLMETIPGKERFLFDGLIEYGFESYTMLDARLVMAFPKPIVTLNQKGVILTHDKPTWEGMYTVIELCAGMGCMGMGSLSAGFRPTIAVDHNLKFLELYEMHAPVHTIHGCIGSNDTVRSIWKRQRQPAPVASGIACQPYSRLGDERSAEDPRSRTLPATLRTSFLLRAPAIILECVEPAYRDKFVQGEIDAFCAASGYSKSQVCLQLSDVWPCSRPRWWCVLLAPEFGQLELQGFPCLTEVTAIEHVIPVFTPWQDFDEQELKLTREEEEAFGVLSGGVFRHVMNMKGKAPCALHAWGSQLAPCPCGCRSMPLSSTRLQQKGLHGVVIPIPNVLTGEVTYRHIHPNECLALQGADPGVDFGDNLKLTLSGVGQCASPLQACWIFSQLGAHFGSLRGNSGETPPVFHLQALRSWIISRCTKVWKTEVPKFADEKFASLVRFWLTAEDLSLEQVMDCNRWIDLLQPFYGLGHVLDHIIRHANVVPVVQPVAAITDFADHDEDVSCPISEAAVAPAVDASVGAARLDPPCTGSVVAPCTDVQQHIDPCTASETPCLTALQLSCTKLGLPVSQLAATDPAACTVVWIDR